MNFSPTNRLEPVGAGEAFLCRLSQLLHAEKHETAPHQGPQFKEFPW